MGVSIDKSILFALLEFDYSLTVFKTEINLSVFQTLQIGPMLKVFTEIFLKQKQKRFFLWYCATSHQTQVYKSFCWLHVQMTWCRNVLATSWPVCIHTHTLACTRTCVHVCVHTCMSIHTCICKTYRIITVQFL